MDERFRDLGGRYPGWSVVSLSEQLRREGMSVPPDVSSHDLIVFADAYYLDHSPPAPPRPPSVSRNPAPFLRTTSVSDINQLSASRFSAAASNHRTNDTHRLSVRSTGSNYSYQSTGRGGYVAPPALSVATDNSGPRMQFVERPPMDPPMQQQQQQQEQHFQRSSAARLSNDTRSTSFDLQQRYRSTSIGSRRSLPTTDNGPNNHHSSNSGNNNNNSYVDGSASDIGPSIERTRAEKRLSARRAALRELERASLRDLETRSQSSTSRRSKAGGPKRALHPRKQRTLDRELSGGMRRLSAGGLSALSAGLGASAVVGSGGVVPGMAAGEGGADDDAGIAALSAAVAAARADVFDIGDELPDPEVEFGKPNKKAAREYASQHQARRADGSRFPVWRTRTGRFCFWDSNICDVFDEQNVSEFASFGAGVSLHFKLMKWFIWMFFLTTLLTIPQMALNGVGAADGANDRGGGIFSTSLGNLDERVIVEDAPVPTIITANGTILLPSTEIEEQTPQQQAQASPALSSDDQAGDTEQANGPPLVIISGFSCNKEFDENGNVATEEVDEEGIGETCVLTRSTVASIYVALDLMVCVAFVVSLLWLHYFLHYEGRVIALAYTTTDQYTVQVKRVPPGSGEMAIAQFFSEVVDDVADVAVAQNNGRLIKLYVERGEALVELWKAAGYVRQLFENNRKLLSSTRDTRRARTVQGKLREAVRYYDEQYARFVTINERRRNLGSSGGVNSITAFVTFKSREAYELSLELYRPRRDLRGRCMRQPSELRLQGRTVRVKPAPPPSTILWENLEFSRLSRAARQLTGTIVVAFVVLVSVGATYGARAYRSELSRALESVDGAVCSDVAVDYNVSTSLQNEQLLTAFELASLEGSPQELECLCSLLSFSRAVNALLDGSHPCNGFYTSRAPLYTFTTLAAGVISVVNVACGMVIRTLTSWEKHHSVVMQEFSVGVRLFFVYLLNTGFVLLIVNARFPALGQATSLFGNGVYDDFTSDWYANVGEQIVVTMLINMFVPHVAPLAGVLMSWLTIKLSSPVVQKELNQMHVGPEFSLSVRSAHLLMTGTVTLMFGGGLPILYPIACVTFMLYYWIDKFLLVRYYRHPPEYDAKLSRWTVFVMSFAVVLHLGFTIWMYTTPGMLVASKEETLSRNATALVETATASIGGSGEAFFVGESGGNGDHDETGPSSSASAQAWYEEVDGMFFEGFGDTRRELWNRVTAPHVMPLSVLLLVAAVVTLLLVLSSMLFSRGRLNRIFFPRVSLAGELPSFEVAQDSGELRGLQTYNILHNPKYALAFGVTRAFADANKHVGDVRELPESQIPKIQEEVRALGIV